MRSCTSVFLRCVDELPDAEFSELTELPGWARSHVVAHVHFNALALLRLVTWAKTGVQAPMYPSKQARDAEIEDGSSLPPGKLRHLAHTSAGMLGEELASLTPGEWVKTVRTVTGRTILAEEIPWLRAREVAIHAVDLGSGISFETLPSVLIEELVTESVRARLQAGEGSVLASWLTGRGTTTALAPWL